MGRIDAVDVSWSAGRTPLLHGVDLEARAGTVVGLLGPNGSGKSTLLRVLAGLRRPTTGSVRYDGRDLAGVPRRVLARRTAVVEQDAVANADVTVRQVVELGRSPFRGRFEALSSRDDEIVDDALSRVNLLDAQHRSWHTLSGGERQRVQLARALAQEPTELLLDEPTNHLDVRHQLELLELLGGLGVTAVVALHDLNLAARYCSHVVVLDQGRVVATGTPADVLDEHLLRRVYQVETRIEADPVSGVPRITFVAPTS